MFNYKWTLKDAIFTKDKGTVFSCFACGGGSTMGYKLAGFDVLGCNEIDPKMMEAYIANHNPKYAFLEPIQTFKLRNDLPSDLYNLDILDGSPPCSSFSMSGNRENDWGKEKVFREGQAKQVLDTLFFDFIDLAKKLQPKVVIAENVKGLLYGTARSYVSRIYHEFDLAGYYIQHFLLDASKMGVPQRRERVFFIALRKDLAEPFLVSKDMFSVVPLLDMNFNEEKIPFSKIIQDTDDEIGYKAPKCVYPELSKCKPGDCCSKFSNKGSFSNYSLIDTNKPIGTITAGSFKSRCGYFRKKDNWFYGISKNQCILCQTYPTDYDFGKQDPYYLAGMSVPPVMMAQIAKQVHNQWF